MAKQYDAPPPMVIDPTKRYTATISTDQGDIVIELFADKAPHDRQQLRLPGPRRLLRRRHLPPRHQGLHGAGRRSHRQRQRRPRLPFADEFHPALKHDQARHPLDGQRRPGHQRLAVLHHVRATRRTSTASTPCSGASSRAWTCVEAIPERDPQRAREPGVAMNSVTIAEEEWVT